MFSLINALGLWLKMHVRSERGQDLIEYALLGGLIAGALLAVAVLTGLTNAVTGMANGIGDCIDFDSTTDCEA
jgi:Flp pilus assembly pilin Flp